MSPSVPTPPPFDTIEECVSRRFERIARAFAEHVAVDDGRRRLTYSALADEVDSIATAVAARARSDRPVTGVLLPTHAGHIASVLGTLRCGRVYASLDPGYPEARLRAMVAEVDAGLVVTERALEPLARALGVPTVLCLEDVPQARWSGGPVATTGLSFACLYFTSGSTGVPKAIVHTHRNILFDIRRQTRDMGITPADRFDLLFSASFSAFLSPVFGALLTGASVHPFALKTHPFEVFRDWLQERRITVSTMSVSSFRQLVATLPPRRGFPDLRMLSVGAEPLTLQDLSSFRRHFPVACRMQNALATTETRTIAQVLLPADGSMPAAMSVGTAVDGKSLRLVDADGAPVPTGEAGEIVIESEFISPGQWRDLRGLAGCALPAPRLTTHRTGDLARQLPDGSLVHLGRTDMQVKVRGHRIEVAEVESRLLACDGIADAAVFTAPGPGGRDLLAALVVAARGGAASSVASLRERLASVLPDYMVPQRIVVVPDLPRTPTGKLARRDLPARLAAAEAQPAPDPDAATASTSDGGSDLEARLVRLWRRVLAQPAAGPDADFFAHGGDSLSAVELFGAIARECGLQAPVNLLVAAPTPRRLAARLQTSAETRALPAPVLLRPGGERPPLYLFPPWGNSSVMFRNLAGPQPMPGALFALEGGLAGTEAATLPSIEAIAELYVSELLALHPQGDFSIGGYSMGGLVAWETAQRLERAGRRPRRLVVLDSPRLYSLRTAEEQAFAASAARPGTIARNLARALVRGSPGGRTLIMRQMGAAVWTKVRWIARDRHAARRREAWHEEFDRNLELSRRYRVEPYAGPVVLIRADNQVDWLTRFSWDLGWADHCPGGLEVHRVPGTHITLFLPPRVARLGAVLERVLAG